jgi:hypothetical protein
LKDIGTVTNIDFSLKNRSLQEILKILGTTKKIGYKTTTFENNLRT